MITVCSASGLSTRSIERLSTCRISGNADAGIDPSFHARYSVKSKVYLYRICNRPVRSALERHYAWFVWEPLSLSKINGVLDLFLGRHDFSSFCSTHTDSPDHVRTILDITVEKNGEDMIDISVEADGFLRYMVRTIVGTLVDVGRGKRSAEEVAAIRATPASPGAVNGTKHTLPRRRPTPSPPAARLSISSLIALPSTPEPQRESFCQAASNQGNT